MLGGNLGNTNLVFYSAIQLLAEEAGTIEKTSSVYVSEPWGISDQPLFKNQALVLKTQLTPHELLVVAKGIEKKLGRKTTVINGPREIDIDILLFGDLIINEHDLQIPHARLHLRKFNLLPLSEIAAEWIHPVLKTTIRELNDGCTDTLTVEKMPLHGTE